MTRFALPGIIVGVIVAVITASASATSRPPFPGDKLDLRSVSPAEVSALDLVGDVAQGSISGKGNPPRVGPNVRGNAPQAGLPDGLYGRSETTLTYDPATNNVVAGWNDAQGFCGLPFGYPCTPQSPAGLSGYAYSTDGGKTWTDGGAPDPFGGVLSRGDPWLDDNGKGIYYYANLAVDATTGASLGIGIWRGGFSGSSFAWNDVATFDSPTNAVIPRFDFYDKEALVAGKKAYANDVYVSLANIIGFKASENTACPSDLPRWGFGQIEVWRSHDGGVTWQGPAVPGTEAGDSIASCAFAGTVQTSSAPAVGPNGDVYVVWQYGPTFALDLSTSADADIVLARSTDGGATWSVPVKVADVNAMRATPPIGYNRARINTHPRIEVVQTGRHKGRVWVTYYSPVSPVPGSTSTSSLTTQSLVSSQVYARYSDDGGATWSSAIAMPGDVGATGTKRWWPDVTIGPGGDVHVVYYEENAVDLVAGDECPISIGGPLVRNGEYSSLVDTWWTWSKDGDGAFSMPIKVSEQTSNVCRSASNLRPNLGDYNDAEAFGGNKVATTWAGAPNFDPASPAPTDTPIVPVDTVFAVAKG